MKKIISAIFLGLLVTGISIPSASAAGEPVLSPPPESIGDPDVVVSRVAGADRYLTSIEVARRVAPTTNEMVLVNGADGAVDSLSGGPLAASLSTGLILTAKDALPVSVRGYVRQSGITRVYVLGGTGVVSESVVNELKNLSASVVRVSGADRYATSLAVSRLASLRNSDTAVIAGGQAAADAVSAGGIAGALRSPVVLVPKDGLIGPEYDTVRAHKNVVVTGGTSAVSASVARQIGSTLRLSQSDRYGTSLTIARWGASRGIDPSQVVVATADGANTADALSAAAFGKITILTPGDGWSIYIKQFMNGENTKYVFVVGGKTPQK